MFNEYMVNCSTFYGILSFQWPSTILWHRHPKSCFYERDGSIPFVYRMNLQDAFLQDWGYTYQSESGFLTSIKAWSKWEMSSSFGILGSMNNIKEILGKEFSFFLSNCELMSASIGQECSLNNVSFNEHCHGTTITGVGGASLSTWGNETFIILPNNSALYSIISLTYSSSRFSDGERSWSDSMTACGQQENWGFTPLCNTILVPYLSYELLNKNGMIWVRYRGFTLEPNQYSLAENNSIRICEIPEDFIFTEAQIMVRRVFFTLNFTAMLLTFVTYSIFSTLRTLPGLCIMTVAMTFMVVYAPINDVVMEHYWFCKIAAILSHYFLLSAFVWMNILAWNLVRTFALSSRLKRHQKDIRKQYVRLALFGFGLPALVVVPCVIIDLCECTSLPIWYGAGLSTCWIHDTWGRLVVMDMPMLISLVFNCIFFVMTGMGIRKSRIETKFATSRTKATLAEKLISLLTYIKISSVMGLTWITRFIVYFTGDRVMWYVFIIFTFLQGAFIFVFFGLSAQSRKLWREKLSCLRRARKRQSTAISSSVQKKNTALSKV
ncbi:G-protein coupled receptor Mth2-like [Lytechinus variegatus]|uniref:G-protein coupled receptor Mth2-like n=1 Tax=Lytechinus variegatus TaxID=7654 RepID=UPI001BB2AF6C|nr:G-protein coupled receptor Mth2-like [Lytechinus variegatus]